MIGLAWLASSTWVLPVLTWHHVEFGGVRQSEVRGGNDLYKQKQKRDLKNTLKEEKNKQRKTIHLYVSLFFQGDVCKTEFAGPCLDIHSFLSSVFESSNFIFKRVVEY